MNSKCLRLAPWLIGSIVWLAAAMFGSAGAVEVRCIEESKYKHLYQLFGDDPRKFAAYLEVDPDQHRLPDPEACRAVLVSGGIGDPNDRDKLLDAIVRNKGWLAAVYLNSGGGDVWTGQQLGYLVRAFRLKTVTARNLGNKIFYEPDFALAPLSPAELAPVGAKTAAVANEGQNAPPRCDLYEHPPTARNAAGAVSGIIRPEAFAPTFEADTDYPGGDYRAIDLPTDDPRACQKQCLADAKCGAWAYRKPEGAGHPHCSLKERVLARVSDKLSTAGIARADVPEAIYEENVDRTGSSLPGLFLPQADPRLCQSACLSDARCRAWVYGKPEYMIVRKPYCWLMDRASLVTKTNNLTVSGTVSRLQYAEPTYEENFDNPGSEYREFDLPKADAKLCQSTCIGEARCRAWAYRKPEGRTNNQPHCWLKEHVPSVKKADNLMVSGMVIRVGAFEPIYENDVDRPGQEYRSFDLPLPDPRPCQKSCTEDAKCRAWAYEKPGGAFLVSLAQGWEAYRARQRSILSAPTPDGSDFCASSCVQIQVAGLDRSGVVRVHRPNQGFGAMTQQAETLNMTDLDMPQFYQYMDAGARVTWLMKETSATTTTQTSASRFPRYVLDYLIVHCDVDPEQLQNLEEQLEMTLKELTPVGADVSLGVDHLQAALGALHERRRRAEQCVAKAQEQDRLAAFDAVCGNSCDQKKLGADFDAAVTKIHAQNH
jgi:hypothetical protein